MKFLLIVICSFTLLSFTSCEDDMGKGGGTGSGGMQDANTISKSSTSPKEDETILIPDSALKAD